MPEYQTSGQLVDGEGAGGGSGRPCGLVRYVVGCDSNGKFAEDRSEFVSEVIEMVFAAVVADVARRQVAVVAVALYVADKLRVCASDGVVSDA